MPLPLRSTASSTSFGSSCGCVGIEHAVAAGLVAAVAERDHRIAAGRIEPRVVEVVQHGRICAAIDGLGREQREVDAGRRVRVAAVEQRRVAERAGHVAHALHVQAAIEREADAVAVLREHVLVVRRGLELLELGRRARAQRADRAVAALAIAEPAEQELLDHVERVDHRRAGLAAEIGERVELVGVAHRNRHRRVAAHRHAHHRAEPVHLVVRGAGVARGDELVRRELARAERRARRVRIAVVDEAVRDRGKERVRLARGLRDHAHVTARGAARQPRGLVRQRELERAIGPRALGAERHRGAERDEAGGHDIGRARDRDRGRREGRVRVGGDRRTAEIFSRVVGHRDRAARAERERAARAAAARDGRRRWVGGRRAAARGEGEQRERRK